MVYLPMLVLLAGLLANVAVYKIHHWKYKTYESGGATQSTYPISGYTQAFRHIKYGLYGATLVYILLNPLILNPVEPRPARLVIGASVGAFGVVLLYLSLKALEENYAPCDHGLLPSRRVMHGPYRYLSHPMYIANILQLIGAAIISFGVLIVAIIIVYSCFIYAIAREEKAALDMRFPHEQKAPNPLSPSQSVREGQIGRCSKKGKEQVDLRGRRE